MSKSITIKTSDGEELEINPALTLTVYNGYHDYDFKPEEIESIELRDMTDEEDV